MPRLAGCRGGQTGAPRQQQTAQRCQMQSRQGGQRHVRHRNRQFITVGRHLNRTQRRRYSGPRPRRARTAFSPANALSAASIAQIAGGAGTCASSAPPLSGRPNPSPGTSGMTRGGGRADRSRPRAGGQRSPLPGACGGSRPRVRGGWETRASRRSRANATGGGDAISPGPISARPECALQICGAGTARAITSPVRNPLTKRMDRWCHTAVNSRLTIAPARVQRACHRWPKPL